MIYVNEKFLHITTIGTLILTLITDSLIYPFVFGLCLGQFIRQNRNEKL
jgi:hypothetical protein